MSRFFLFFIFFIFLLSCKSGVDRKEFFDEMGNLVVEESYSSGKLKSRTTYLNEEKSDYLYISYTESGITTDSFKIINNKMEGQRRFYEENSELTHYENYVNGVMNGIHKATFANGVHSFIGQRKNGLKNGGWIFRHEGGDLITYEYYLNGKVVYFRNYSNGKLESYEGEEGLFNVKLSTLNNKPSLDATLTFSAIQPPDCAIELELFDKTSNKTYKIGNLSIEKGVFSFSFDTPGKKDLLLTLRLITGNEDEEKYEKEIYYEVL